MTEFCLNAEFENLIKATLIADDMNKQQQQQNMMTNKEYNKSAKSLDFFQDNNAIKKDKRLIQQLEFNQEIFYQIFCMLVSIGKIFTMKIMYLIFTRFGEKFKSIFIGWKIK